MATLLSGLESHHRRHSRPADSPAFVVEDLCPRRRAGRKAGNVRVSGGKTALQQRQVARARDTVPLATSASDSGSNISNVTCGGPSVGRVTLGCRRAHLRLGFRHSQKRAHEGNLRAAVG